MRAIFLSASIPLAKGRGDYYKTANPFLIQCAVRELVIAVIPHYKIVWGGHPAITPMIQSICKDLEVNYSENVVLYQSKYFDGLFPDENKFFGNVIYTDKVDKDRDASLLLMREEMLSREDLDAAVFIGGMDGVEKECELFRKHHPEAKVLPVAAAGGAALILAKQLGYKDEELRDIDFANFFNKHLVRDENLLEDRDTDGAGLRFN